MTFKLLNERLIFGDPAKSEEAVGPVLKGIDYTGTVCEDCNKVLNEKRVIDITKRQTPFCFWSHKCKNCGLHKDPETGKFTLTSQQKATVLATMKRKQDK